MKGSLAPDLESSSTNLATYLAFCLLSDKISTALSRPIIPVARATVGNSEPTSNNSGLSLAIASVCESKRRKNKRVERVEVRGYAK